MEEESKEPKKRVPRLGESAWQEIAAKYRTGNYTIGELAKEYKVSTSTIHNQFKARKVEKGSAAKEMTKIIAAKESEKVAEIASEFAIKKLQRIEETKEESYESARMISKLITGRIVKAIKDKREIATEENNIRVLANAAKALSITRKERFEILDIQENDGDDDDLPKIIVEDLSEVEISQLRAQKENDDTNDTFEDFEAIIEIEEDE